MQLRIVDNTVVGLPEDTTIFFLAKTSQHGIPGYYAVFGPNATCLPKPGDAYAEMFDAKVAVFHADGSMATVYDAHHGHKYALGGGMLETSKHNTDQTITWTTPDECGCCRIFGERIHPRDVLIAL